MTSFTRIVIVLSLLRQALGVQQVPPNQVLIGLALLLTIFIMRPVGERLHTQVVQPYLAQSLTTPAALQQAAGAPARFYADARLVRKIWPLFIPDCACIQAEYPG
jgi:flagellar biosynthetic protein FliP